MNLSRLNAAMWQKGSELSRGYWFQKVEISHGTWVTPRGFYDDRRMDFIYRGSRKIAHWEVSTQFQATGE